MFVYISMHSSEQLYANDFNAVLHYNTFRNLYTGMALFYILALIGGNIQQIEFDNKDSCFECFRENRIVAIFERADERLLKIHATFRLDFVEKIKKGGNLTFLIQFITL